MKKLYLVFITSGNIRIETAIWLSKIMVDTKYELSVGYSYKEPLQSNRNYVAKKFLETDCSHLIMIDADTVPPDNFLDLIELDKDIISPLYCGWKGTDLLPMLFKKKGNEYVTIKGEGLLEVDAIGGGAMIIKRKVLEKINKPFEVRFDKEGIATLSEDFAFSEKAKKAGFEMWVHTDYLCNHYKTINLESIYKFLQEKTKDEN